MKSTTTTTLLLLLLLSFPGFGSSESWFTNLKVNPPALTHLAKKLVVFDLDPGKSKEAYRRHPQTLTLQIPFPEGLKTLHFESNDIHASGFQVLDAQNKDVSNSLSYPHHYKGMDNKRGKALASLSLFSDGHFVLVYSDGNGNVNIARLPEGLGKENQYVAFNDEQLTRKNPFVCKVDHDEVNPRQKKSTPTQIQDDTSCRLTEIYWECDHDMFQKGGNSIQGALNQFEAMFNGTAILYERETINIGVKAVKVWNTPDPYSYNSSFSALGDFQQAGNAADWPGQLAHLLSTRPLSLGGVAFLDALCSDFRYGFSNIDFLFSGLPAYSWTLSTIAHELGHNFSSNHTHNCGWPIAPGVFGQIDSCWNAEGDCQPLVRGRVGSIMSYCHLTGSVNLALGFGPLPGNKIREAYANMSCVSGNIVIPDFTPVNSGPFCVGDTVRLSAENLSGFSYKWTGPNGFSSTELSPFLNNLDPSAEGKYSLTLKKASCESRAKKTDLVFNCLQVKALPNAVCAGSNLSISFFSTGTFNPGNRFIAQLSNNAGSFANPVLLDTLTSVSPDGTLNADLPANLPLGTNYKIRLVSTNPAYVGKSPLRNLTIQAVGTSPQPQNGERCGPGVVQIGASGGSNLLWFPSREETVPIGSGRRFTSPPIEQTTPFYVQSGGSTRARAGIPAPSIQSTSSDLSNGFNLEILATLRLDSITLYHSDLPSADTLCRITLRKNGVVWYSRVVITSGSISKIPLFWRMDPGTGYDLRCEEIRKPITVSTGAWGSYPMNYPALLRIESNLAGNSASYPYMFSWVISKYSGCPSLKVEVKAVVRSGQAPETPQAVQVADSVQCSIPAVQYQWQVNGQIQANLNIRKIRGFQNSSYQVRYKTDSCWSEWSVPTTVVITSLTGKTAKDHPAFYPNPTAGMLLWKDVPENLTLKLHSADGKLVLTKQISTLEPTTLEGLPKGIYFLRWESEAASGSGLLRLE